MVLSRLGPVTRSQTSGKRKRLASPLRALPRTDPGLAGGGEDGTRVAEESQRYECFVCNSVKSSRQTRCVKAAYHGIALRNFASQLRPANRTHIERRTDYVVQPGDRVCTQCLLTWTQHRNTPRVYKCPRVKCILCDTEKKNTRMVHAMYVGTKVKTLPIRIMSDCSSDAAHARIRSIQDYVIQRGDRVCTLCVETHARFLVYASRDCSFAASRAHATESVATDARRTLLVATALSTDAIRGLTHRLEFETAGWDFPTQDVVTAPVGQWWSNLRTGDNDSRLQQLERHAAKHPSVAAALDVLKSHTPTIGVEEDARRTLLVAIALNKDAKRRLTMRLKLETAGWDFPAEDVVTAPVGRWWHDVRFFDHGSRLQRLETHAAKHPDVAAALDVLKSRTKKRHT